MNRAPLAVRILADIRMRIISGEYRPRTTLPHPRSVAEKWECPEHIVRRVYGVLLNEGLLAHQPMKPPVVRLRAPSGARGAALDPSAGDNDSGAMGLYRRAPDYRWQSRHRGPLYVLLATQLRERLEADEWPPGGKLPSMETLAVEAGCSPTPVKQAMELLEGEGMTERHPGMGWFRTRGTD